jgi:hypothetical protein
VSGATTLSSTLAVTGATTLSSTLAVKEAITATGGLITNSITGAVSVSGGLGIAGATASANTLNIGTDVNEQAFIAAGGINCLILDKTSGDNRVTVYNGKFAVGSVVMDSSTNKITGLVDPTTTDGAATKAYADTKQPLIKTSTGVGQFLPLQVAGVPTSTAVTPQYLNSSCNAGTWAVYLGTSGSAGVFANGLSYAGIYNYNGTIYTTSGTNNVAGFAWRIS